MHKKIVYGAIIFLFVTAVTMGFNLQILNYCFDLNENASIRLAFSFFCRNIHNSMIILQFVLATSVVTVRFKYLNNWLNRTSSKGPIGITRVFMLRKVHQTLCDSIDIINETFTFYLALILMHILVSH